MGVSTEEPTGREPPPVSQDGVARDFNALRKRAEKHRTRSSWAMRLLALGLLVTVIVPVLWVLLYGVIEAPTTLLMIQRGFEGEKIQHRTVALSDISPHLVRAVIAAEDANFCSHDGFDVEAIQKAVKYNERARRRGSEKRRGASTVSQQTAKNLFLWPKRSWLRKGAEVYFTFLIETVWPKRRIMEAYLNAVEWGDGVFGAEAAARARFGVAARDLSPGQAAALAAVLPSPNKWSAVKPGPYVRGRIRAIVSRASVVRNEGYAACVLGKERAAPRPGRRKPPPISDLPPLPPPPPELAPPEEGAPTDTVAQDPGAPPDAATSEAPSPDAPTSDATGAEPQPDPSEETPPPT